ncbi:MAG: hypothetical protein J5546_04530 [Lachnospiraceae bacterium]|nr:hypothetical protein [Lachnospiraceae bacterium]
MENNFEDSRKKSPEELQMEEEELRELQERIEKQEQEFLDQEARRRLRKKLKYRFALSNDGILLLLVAGGWLAFALLRTGLVRLIFRGKESALQTIWIIIGMAVFAICWIVISLILRGMMKKEAAELIASGQVTLEDALRYYEKDYLPKPEKKRASEVLIEFPIETFETLSEMDFDLADEEWDRLDKTVTERFARMPVFIQHFEGSAVFSVYLELRYESAYPNYRLLLKTLESIKTELADLRYDAKTELSDYKEKAREVARECLKKSFPDLHISEICIALKQIA